MSKHFKHHQTLDEFSQSCMTAFADAVEPKEVIDSSWGDSEPGVVELNGFGICEKCARQWGPGVYICLVCSEQY